MKTTALRERTIKTLKIGHYSERTIDTYISWLSRMAQHCGCSPADLDAEQVQAFLHHLIEHEQLSWSTVNQALAACRFFYEKVLYRPHFDLHVPARRKVTRRASVYSKKQVAAILASAQNPKHRALLMSIYGAGLRVGEAVVLRPEHIESQRGLLRVEQGKGRKDRYTLLPDRLLAELRAYWRAFHPGEWLFFGRDKTKPLSVGSAQKIFYLVRNRAGITHGGIHTLRHCFATHMLEAGSDIYELKRMMGHSAIKTTSGYIHISREHLQSVRSPLESI
jgi:site-specific recombinase XerD